MRHEASFYENIGDSVRCLLCPHFCLLKEGGLGFCRARSMSGKKLYSDNYGILTAVHLDPIEKKPLSMYRPGTRILSAGSFGCNFRCGFCQNSDISQNIVKSGYVSPERLAEKAYELKEAGNIGIAYTYNEPTVMYEYVYDTSKLLKERYGMDNILVTNGYISEKPLRDLLAYIDAANVDLKSSSQNFYREICRGGLDEVKRNIPIFHENCHLEVTTLVIGGYNDTAEEIDELCSFIASVSRDIPLHLSRFHPAYRFDREQPTPVSKMREAQIIAKKHLNNVYLGNMP